MPGINDRQIDAGKYAQLKLGNDGLLRFRESGKHGFCRLLHGL